MGSIPDPLYDQTSATTVASFSKKGRKSVGKKSAPSKLKIKSPIRKRGSKRP